MAFYYMLHEDTSQLSFNSITHIDPPTFIEFVFERFLDKDNPLFSLDALLGGPARSAQAVSVETEMMCFKIRKVHDTLLSKYDYGSLKETHISEAAWINSQTSSFMGDLFPVSEITTKFKALQASFNHDTSTLEGYLRFGLLDTLKVKCTQRGLTGSQFNDAASTKLLKSKFNQMIQHGIQKKFLDNFEESLGALSKLEKYLSESPECRGLFPFKGTP